MYSLGYGVYFHCVPSYHAKQEANTDVVYHYLLKFICFLQLVLHYHMIITTFSATNLTKIGDVFRSISRVMRAEIESDEFPSIALK